jgi:TetR/AcrR family transcriptional regulator, mexJK operon transcriptional repressor
VRTERRAAILAVAARHFLEQGFSGTTMSSIAADVGGSKGTLWQYFRSKEVLFEAFVDAATERLHCDALARLSEPGDPLAVLRSFVLEVVDVLRSDECLRVQREVGAQAIRLPKVAAMLHHRLVGGLEAPLSAFFAAHMASGALCGDDPAEAAWLALALCLGFDHRRLLWRDEKLTGPEAAACADRVMSILERLYGCRTDALVV